MSGGSEVEVGFKSHYGGLGLGVIGDVSRYAPCAYALCALAAAVCPLLSLPDPEHPMDLTVIGPMLT